MKPHSLKAAMGRVKLRGFTALDRRMAAAREAFAFKSELVRARSVGIAIPAGTFTGQLRFNGSSPAG